MRQFTGKLILRGQNVLQGCWVFDHSYDEDRLQVVEISAINVHHFTSENFEKLEDLKRHTFGFHGEKAMTALPCNNTEPLFES